MLTKFHDYLRFELNRAPLTVKAYETDVEQFLAHSKIDDSRKFDFNSVSTANIRAWIAALAKTGVSPRSLRRKIISLRAFFKWMLKNGYISNSPLEDIPLPKLPRPLPDVIQVNEIEKAITDISSLHKEDPDNPEFIMEALVLDMLFSLGLRRAELIAINDSDISFFNSELKVTGKRAKQRVVPLPQKLLQKISEWQKIRDMDEDSALAQTGNMEHQSVGSPKPLFIVKGKRISPHQVYNIVKRALSNTSARKKSPHALRHSFASAMLNGGAEIDSVREFLGHASLATTQIYTHISLNEIKKAYSLSHPRAQNHKEND